MEQAESSSNNNDVDGVLSSRGDQHVSDAGADPELLSPDLAAACKDNDTLRAKELLVDGVPPGYIDPESGTYTLRSIQYSVSVR